MKELAAALESAILADASRTELAPAKINLALHVTGRRPDGYHQIETLAVFADYGDVVSAVPGSDGRMGLAVRGRFAKALAESSTAADNLVVRASTELARAAPGKKPPATKLSLTKRIPVAAGLGGGSADAAATLRLLNREWGLGIGQDRLAEIGASIGADVPMCIASRPLVATGIGERIRPVEGVPAMPIVLAHPGVSVATASVFGRLSPQERSPLPDMPRFRSLLDVIFWLRKARNDLEEPAGAVSRTAGAAAKVLRSDPECLFARMTGSGATAFGIFASMDAAERAAARLQDAKPRWWVTPAMTGASP